ncbi:MAG: hypothetical protein JNK05_10645 [Myxococcales bacterium]|nr:hypothetical protein [Myxococcales bacterium]
MRAWFAISLGAIVAALGACVPQPDATGRVRCGEGEICPASFECRFGRCCPIGAGASACPTEATLPRIDDGSLACDDNGACPNAYGYECRQGRYCCPRDGNPATGPCARGALGMPCNMTTACVAPTETPNDGGAAAGICRVNVLGFPLPNGYCSSSCNAANLDSCGARGVCISFVLDSLCVARCRLPEGQEIGPCRTEPFGQTPSPYVCLPLAPGDPTNREGYCYPDCTMAPALCGSTGGMCNPQSRRCEMRCTATSCGVGRTCNASSGLCEVADCTASPCASNNVCNPLTRRCVADCRVTPSTCTAIQRCNATTGLCGLR